MNALLTWFWRLGPGNPMVVRIVEGGSRRRQHMIVRMVYLGLLVGLVVLGLLSGGGLMGERVSLNALAKSGAQLFRLIAYGQVIGVCLLAPLFMAGAIASEQSGKTYNILLTTPLSNLQVVLGSLAGRLFFVLTLLLSGLPLFAVVLVFGGVRSGAVFQAFGVAACTAVLVGSVAVTLSVLRAGGRKAVFMFVIAIAAYLLGAYALDRFLLRALDPEPYTTWLTAWHPLLVLESSMLTATYRPPPAEVLVDYPAWQAFWMGRPFAAFAAWTLGLSGMLVLGCSVMLRRVGQGEWGVLNKLKAMLGLGGGERVHTPREVTGNPIAWREAHTRGRGFGAVMARWGFAVLGMAAGVGLTWAYHTGQLPQNLPAASTAVSGRAYLTSAQVFHRGLTVLLVMEIAVVCLVAIYMSAGCVSREREDGTLDILLTTPLTPRQYVWGKLRGLVWFLGVMIAVPVLTLLGVGFYAWIVRQMGMPQGSFTHYDVFGTAAGVSGSVHKDLPLVMPEAGLWLALCLIPFVGLCVGVGITWSLRAKTVLGAVVPTVGIVGLVAMVMGVCGLTPLGSAPVVGPMVNAFSPATNAAVLVNPWGQLMGFGNTAEFGRITLGMAAVVAAGVYWFVVYGLIAATTKNFDQTVRKLSGTG
ncbi:MAG: ABC transporter permease subunit [Algisphaera sp.]